MRCQLALSHPTPLALWPACRWAHGRRGRCRRTLEAIDETKLESVSKVERGGIESIGAASEGAQAAGAASLSWGKVIPVTLVGMIGFGIWSYSSRGGGKFNHQRSVRDEQLRQARKEQEEAGGRRAQAKRAPAAAGGASSAQPSREEAQTMIAALDRRLAANRRQQEQALPSDAVNRQILQAEAEALQQRKAELRSL